VGIFINPIVLLKVNSIVKKIEVNKKLYFGENGYFENENLISSIDQAIDLFVV
jgi:hypothetical protein